MQKNPHFKTDVRELWAAIGCAEWTRSNQARQTVELRIGWFRGKKWHASHLMMLGWWESGSIVPTSPRHVSLDERTSKCENERPKADRIIDDADIEVGSGALDLVTAGPTCQWCTHMCLKWNTKGARFATIAALVVESAQLWHWGPVASRSLYWKCTHSKQQVKTRLEYTCVWRLVWSRCRGGKPQPIRLCDVSEMVEVGESVAP